MIIDQRITIPAAPVRVWDLMMDVPAVSRCVPGVDSTTRVDDDNYRGSLRVKVGPISLRLEGTIVVTERNREAWEAHMEAQAADRRVNGGLKARMAMTLFPRPDGGTDLAIRTDATILGKLGEFGQAVMRKKADQMMAEFANNLSAEVGAREQEQHV